MKGRDYARHRDSTADGLGNTLRVADGGVKSQSVIASLDLDGFSVSTGSACAAACPEPEAVIESMGVDSGYKDGVVRISMGHATTEDEVAGLTACLARNITRAKRAA